MTHDYKRNGTTTLLAAFDLLEGKVIGGCMQRHPHQENAIEAESPGRQNRPCHPRQLRQSQFASFFIWRGFCTSKHQPQRLVRP